MRLYLFAIFFLLTKICFAQSNNDLEILNRLVDKSLMPIQDFFVADSINKIKINIISKDKTLSDLIKIKLLKSVDEDTNSNFSLDILVEKNEVKFPEVVSFPLFGEEKIKRETTLEMHSIISKNGLKIKKFDFNETISDTINLSQISGESFNLKSKLPKIPLYRRLIEPAVISAATGVIVYLFFITRSK